MQGIYKLSFLGTTKIYVGESTCIPTRFSIHISKLIGGKHHNKSMQEYYHKTFILPTLEVLESVGDDSLLDIKEIFWIDKLDSFTNGFNATKGGEGGS